MVSQSQCSVHQLLQSQCSVVISFVLLSCEEDGLVVGEVHSQELLLLQRLHQRPLAALPRPELPLGQRHLGARQLAQQLRPPRRVATVNLKKVRLHSL